MDDNTLASETITGHIKWFDPAKGFGFIVADNDLPDILLHANVLRNFGQSSVADNAIIKARVQKTTKGYQATEVLSITPPHDLKSGLSAFQAPIEKEELVTLAYEPARVKWFDPAKGFGFANTFGCREDVFIHIDLLRQSGLSGLMPGEAVALKVVNGERGRMAVEVSGWEQAAKED